MKVKINKDYSSIKIKIDVWFDKSLSLDKFTPVNIMLEAIMKERYDVFD